MILIQESVAGTNQKINSCPSANAGPRSRRPTTYHTRSRRITATLGLVTPASNTDTRIPRGRVPQ